MHLRLVYILGNLVTQLKLGESYLAAQNLKQSDRNRSPENEIV